MTIVSHIHLKLQIPIPMLLVDCVTKNRLISTLERKRRRRRRLIVMTRSILEKLSFVVHFINDTVSFCHRHQN
jgi:predicted nucleic acid-binding Zn ribbon protein